jgi:hypothetical protein
MVKSSLLSGWQFNLTRSAPFGQWLRLDNVTRVQPTWLSTGSFSNQVRETRGDTNTHSMSPAMGWPTMLRNLPGERTPTDVAPQPWTRIMSQNEQTSFLYNIYCLWCGTVLFATEDGLRHKCTVNGWTKYYGRTSLNNWDLF